MKKVSIFTWYQSYVLGFLPFSVVLDNPDYFILSIQLRFFFSFLFVFKIFYLKVVELCRKVQASLDLWLHQNQTDRTTILTTRLYRKVEWKKKFWNSLYQQNFF